MCALAEWVDNLEPEFVHRMEQLQLESHIGSGHFGDVYRGELELECGAQLQVAVKSLREARRGDPSIVQEARMVL